MAENIAYGTQNGKDTVISLLIDDGIKSRSHRKNVLSEKYTHISPCRGEHHEYKVMDDIIYNGPAEGFTYDETDAS